MRGVQTSLTRAIVLCRKPWLSSTVPLFWPHISPNVFICLDEAITATRPMRCEGASINLRSKLQNILRGTLQWILPLVCPSIDTTSWSLQNMAAARYAKNKRSPCSNEQLNTQQKYLFSEKNIYEWQIISSTCLHFECFSQMIISVCAAFKFVLLP